MSNFPKIHGLELAQNGYIMNAVIEQLAADPLGPFPGRLWFNTTEKRFKFTGLNGSGVGTIYTFGTYEELQAFITSLAAETTNDSGAKKVGYDGQTGTNGLFSLSAGKVDAALDSIVLKVDANSKAIADIGSGNLVSLQAAIDAETTARIAADNAELTARTAADTTLQANIDAEVTARTLADGSLQASINAEATARIAAVAAEATAREAADANLTSALNAEITARTAADTTLQSNINAEATARSLADTTLQANIDAEEIARENADVTLQANIDLKVAKAGDTMTGNLAFGGTAKVTGLAAPTQAEDAATKNYVDSLLSGLSWKMAVDSVGATNPGSGTEGARFLNTTDGKIYTYTSSAWVAGPAPVDGDSVFDRTNETGYVYTGSVWTQFTGTGQIAAGVGLVKVGNQIDVNLGAGIAQLPTDEVGIDLRGTGGLFLTLDGTNDSLDDAAGQVAIKLNGTDLFTDADGIKISTTYKQSVTTEITAAVAVETTARTAADNAEATARAAADATLQANLNAEATARAAADATLQANIDAEATARSDADATLQAGLNTEITARTAADTTLQNNLNTETTARIAADATLQANIDAEKTARIAADGAVTGAVDAETTARIAADTTLQANIDAEVTARSLADATLQSNITAEANARIAADGTLQSNITAEANARSSADTNLQNAINAEATARADADTTLQANVDAEVTARINAVATLRTNINARTFTFESSSPATSHVVAHNLSTAFANVSVFVFRDSGAGGDDLWHNDIVAVTLDSNNQLTVDLTEAANIRVSIFSMTDV